jgi:hypothetical protein
MTVSPENDGRRHNELVVVPRTAVLQAAERELGLALVAVVAGTRPPVSPAMVQDYLAAQFGIDDAVVRRHDPDDFVVRFSRREDLELVLHSTVHEPPFRLIWHPWRRMSMVTAGSFHYRVVIGMRRVPLHARSMAVAQIILGRACAQIELAPPEVCPENDDSEFFVAAWCKHPSFIDDEKIIFIPEPNVRIPGHALYLHTNEIVLNRLPGLQYLVCIRIVEFQDWSTPPPSSDEGSGGGNLDDDDFDDRHFNGHPGMDMGGDRSHGPRMVWCTDAEDDTSRLGSHRGTTFIPHRFMLVGSIACRLGQVDRLVAGSRFTHPDSRRRTMAGTAPDASPARGTVATVLEEPVAGELVAPDAAVVLSAPCEIVAQQLSSVQPHGVQEAPVLEKLGPVGGPDVEAVPMAINSLAIVVYKDENGTEISRTEPHRFLYFIRSNSYFCVRLYRFRFRFRISNVKVENGLDIFRPFPTVFYF